MPKIAIIGTTSWGITLGMVEAGKGLEVRLWARTKEEAAKLTKGKLDHPVLKGVSLPRSLSFTNSLPEALDEARLVILAVPSQTVRRNTRLFAQHLNRSTLVVSAAKGLELETGKRMSQVISEEIDAALKPNICALSGPNLSQEVLKKYPSVTVIAAEDEAVAKKAQKLLTAPHFCVYTNTDIIGVELGGAFKNVIALGAGIADGLGYGDNTKAALMTRGLTEMTALGLALGANPLTFSGLAGLGDLIATCSSPLSRNHYVGFELARGRPLKKIISSMEGVAEGVSTTLAVWKLAEKLGLEMPITEKVYQVLYKGLDVRKAADALMAAETRNELSGRKWRLFSFLRRRKAEKLEEMEEQA